MTDESAWWASSSISIAADKWGTISWYDANSYGVKTFNFTAPANPGPNPIDVTITYSITDAGGNVTTETQVVSVAAEVAPNQAPVAWDTTQDWSWAWAWSVDLAALISDDHTSDANMVVTIESNPDWFSYDLSDLSSVPLIAPGWLSWNTNLVFKACDEENACDTWTINITNWSN